MRSVSQTTRDADHPVDLPGVRGVRVEWPLGWGDQPDGRLVGNTNASGFYLTGGEWLHFVFQARRESGGVRWTARVTNPATGEVFADLSALESSPTPLAGTFFLHGYSVDAGRMWANLVFDATIDTSN